MRPPLILRLLLCLLAYMPLQAQYLVQPVPPPPTFSFNDLWHLSVIRTAADDNKEFYISLRIYDQNNTLKIKSNTSTLVLPTGTHYYNLSNISALQPFATSYYDASVLQQAIASGGMFPQGTYNLVYTLYGKAADGEFAPLSENAAEAIVDALWPPMLLSPPDGDSIQTQYPLLTWAPAFSSAYAGQITYTLNLVELSPGQNAYQAIAANPIYFSQNNLPNTLLPYPPSAQILDTTKVYAWQVHADAQGSSLGSSEIWTFTWKKTKEKKLPKIKSYFTLTEKLSAEFVYISTPFLPIVTVEKYSLASMSAFRFKILNEQKEIIATEKDFDQVIKTGYNNYLIPICSSEGKISLAKGKYYLELELKKGKKEFLGFEVKQGNCQ